MIFWFIKQISDVRSEYFAADDDSDDDNDDDDDGYGDDDDIVGVDNVFSVV